MISWRDIALGHTSTFWKKWLTTQRLVNSSTQLDQRRRGNLGMYRDRYVTKFVSIVMLLTSRPGLSFSSLPLSSHHITVGSSRWKLWSGDHAGMQHKVMIISVTFIGHYSNFFSPFPRLPSIPSIAVHYWFARAQSWRHRSSWPVWKNASDLRQQKYHDER